MQTLSQVIDLARERLPKLDRDLKAYETAIGLKERGANRFEILKVLKLTYIDMEDCEAELDSSRDLRDAFQMVRKGRELFPD